MNPALEALHRLSDGNYAHARHVREWAWIPTDRKATAKRVGGLLLGAWATLTVGYGGIAGVGVWWIWQSWRHAPSRTEMARGRFAGYVVELIGDRAGIHLDELQAVINDGGLGWDRAELRSGLDRMSIPVRASVRVDGKVRTGIHRDDVNPAPPEGVPLIGRLRSALTRDVLHEEKAVEGPERAVAREDRP